MTADYYPLFPNSSSVEVKIEEDTSYDSETSHTTETVSFMAVEGEGVISGEAIATEPQLPLQVFAETGTISLTDAAENDAEFVQTHQRNSTANGFEVAMEEEEANQNSGHGTETVGWLAMERGQVNGAR